MAVGWTEDLAIGVEEIDAQHREIFSRFGLLGTACDQGRGREEMVPLIEFLDGYVKSHFSGEESLQVEHEFPGFASHREEHRWFDARLSSLKTRILREGITPNAIAAVRGELVRWLILHIRRTDREFGEYLKARTG